MAQLTYSDAFAPAAYAGQLSDAGHHDVMSAEFLPIGAILITPTAAASTAYAVTFGAAGAGLVANFTSTSGTPTAASIAAGLAAAANLLPAVDYQAFVYNGLLALLPKAASVDQAVASTGAGTLAVAAAAPSIAFGRAVCIETNFTEGTLRVVRLPASAADVANLLGCTLSSHFLESQYLPGLPLAEPQFAVGTTLNVLRQGRVWVVTEAAVTAGQQVFVRHTAAGALTKLGGFTTVAATATATAIAAQWLDTAAAGEFARIQLNLP